jgi:hypothetical protein
MALITHLTPALDLAARDVLRNTNAANNVATFFAPQLREGYEDQECVRLHHLLWPVPYHMLYMTLYTTDSTQCHDTPFTVVNRVTLAQVWGAEDCS